MLNVTELCGFGAGGRSPVIGSYVTTVTSTSNLTTYTFSGASLGTEAPNRTIVVAVCGQGSTTGDISTVSIAGISADFAIRETASGNNVSVGIAYAHVPAGTTGDIEIVFSDAKLNCSVSIYSVLGEYPLLVKDTDVQESIGTATTMTAVIDTEKNGYLISIVGNASTATYTWSGVTEQYDATVETRRSSASIDGTGSAITVEATASTDVTQSFASACFY